MVIFGISILTGSGVTFAQESEDISIIFDQDQYTWTDKVKVTIIAPDYNKSEEKIDIIGESGTVLTISTKNHLITKFPMKETGPDTGIFSKEIILTGFAHDADGNSQTGDKNGNDVLGLDYVSEGAAIGDFLSSDDDDTVLVKFTAMEQGIEKYSVEKTVQVMWSVGEIQFERKSYSDNDVAKVIVKDPDMNWDPRKIDGFVIDVWSDSYFAGVNVNMSETDINAGIFEGTIVLSTKNSSEDKLLVVEGDSVTAEYEDNTLPNPYSPADEMNIKDRTIIRNPSLFSENIAPLKQLKMGVSASEIQCRENLVLILKYDLTPACVSEKTQNQLILRNWAYQENMGNNEMSSNDDTIQQRPILTLENSKQDIELVKAFKEKYSRFNIQEYSDSNGITWKYSIMTDEREVELIFGENRTILRAFHPKNYDGICTIVNPFPEDVIDYCPPKW